MLVLFVVCAVAVAILLPEVAGKLCSISDCSLRVPSNCSFVAKKECYTALDQPKPKTGDPEHLFNLLYDPLEKGCVSLKVQTLIKSDEAVLKLDVYCKSSLSESVVKYFVINFSATGKPGSISCFGNAEMCKLLNHEQLRLSFLGNGDELMLDDLSSKVPKGSWMWLRKTECTKNETCVCQNFNAMKKDNSECTKISTQVTTASAINWKWVVGASIGGFALVVLVSLCIKKNFLKQCLNRSRVDIQPTSQKIFAK